MTYDQELVDELTALGDRFGPDTVLAAATATLAPGDEVELYVRDDGDYGWRYTAAGNHEPLAGPQEGYADKAHALRMARRVTHRDPVDRT